MTPRHAKAVLQAVCEASGLTLDELRAPCHRSDRLVPRQLAALVLRDMGFSFPSIADYIKRHHSTTWHAVDNAADKARADPAFQELRVRIRNRATVIATGPISRKDQHRQVISGDVRISTGPTAASSLEGSGEEDSKRGPGAADG